MAASPSRMDCRQTISNLNCNSYRRLSFCLTGLVLFVLHLRGVSPSTPLPEDVDYRHVHREAAEHLFQGRAGEALEWTEPFTKSNPKDPEGWFFHAGALAQESQWEEVEYAVKKALEAGLAPERFFAGPQTAFQPLVHSRAFTNALGSTPVSSLIHGPMLGDVRPRGISIWFRTAKESSVGIEVAELLSNRTVFRGATRTRKENDRTGIIHVTGLQPLTQYQYSLEIDGTVPRPFGEGKFRTAPENGQSMETIRIAIGGCAAYKPSLEGIWDLVRDRNPELFLTLGDNVYIDAPEFPSYQRYKYYRRQSRPEFRRLVSATPTYAIWDDHDFAGNDCFGGPRVDQPDWKKKVWTVFRENWVNPAYGDGLSHPGCYFPFSYGDIDFFMLDDRYYRLNPETVPPEQRTMLGPVQKKWLLQALGSSQATFKVLASGVPWAVGTKPGSLDTWDGFDQERREIFDFIVDNRIEGVLLISADRHRHDIWKIDHPGCYPLYEFESAKLTSVHTHPTMEKALFSINPRGFGLFEFHTAAENPWFRYQVITEENEVGYEFSVRHSELRFQ